MIFTKEKFKEAYCKAAESFKEVDTVMVLNRMAGEELGYVKFSYSEYLRKTPRSEVTEWINTNILEAYGFTESSVDISVTADTTDKSWSLRQVDHIWWGAEGMVFMMNTAGYPEYMFYTEEAQKEVIELLDLWYTYVMPKITIERKKTRFVNIMLHSERSGFSEATIPLGDKLDIDISKNYMPSLPDAKIQEKIRSDRGGFLIFNGDPGTGKSTYLKYLMETMEDVNFVILDPNALQMGAEEFKNYLIQNTLNNGQSLNIECGEEEAWDPEPEFAAPVKGTVGIAKAAALGGTLAATSKLKVKKNYAIVKRSTTVKDIKKKDEKPKPIRTVFILEDAEKLLRKRSETTNPVNLSNVLNITDGIIGDLVKVKFVCTFNCDLTELDPALLRKGRLLQKYEFPKLTGEPLKKLADELGIPANKRKGAMSLAEIYGWDTDTGISEAEKGRIGF